MSLPAAFVFGVFSMAISLLTLIYGAGAFAHALAGWAGVAALLLLRALHGEGLAEGAEAVVLPAVAALIVVVGALAALGPARQGLRVQPTEALRDGQ